MPTPAHWTLDSTVGPTLDTLSNVYTLDQQPPWDTSMALVQVQPVIIAGTVLIPPPA